MGSDDIAKKRIAANRERRNLQKTNRKIRNVGNRTLIPNILILTEGYSEDIYFKELIRILSLNTVKSRKSISTDCNGILGEAESEALKSNETDNELNYIFCIFDLDSVKNRTHLDYLARMNSNFTRIIPIYSFPCIEIWFLLHFECTTRPFNSQGKKSIGEVIKDYFQSTYAPDYTETNKNVIESLVPDYERAIYNSIRLCNQQSKVNSINPITNMHALITLLKNISERSQNYVYEDVYQSFIQENI
ncbi:RloB domain-containing protein [Acinetobacter baumannii]|nr:RloB domain-containing protein [Acinetobacter baumannii]